MATLLHEKAPAVAFGLDPAEAVINATGHIRLVACSIPRLALVVWMLLIRRQVAGVKYGVILGIAQERVEHRPYLSLGCMSPDRIGEKDVECLAEHRGVEIRVGVEPRPLELKHFPLQDRIHTHCESLRMRLDAAIAGWIQEMNEPISKAQDSAAQIDDLGIRIKPGRQQIDEVLSATLFKIQDGNAEKGLRAQDFGLLLQLPWTPPTGMSNPAPPAAGEGVAASP